MKFNANVQRQRFTWMVIPKSCFLTGDDMLPHMQTLVFWNMNKACHYNDLLLHFETQSDTTKLDSLVFISLFSISCVSYVRGALRLSLWNINKLYTRSVVQPKATWWFTGGPSLHPLLDLKVILWEVAFPYLWATIGCLVHVAYVWTSGWFGLQKLNKNGKLYICK